MFYIVGLGNPGEKYEMTRHNVGFIVLKELVDHKSLPSPIASSKFGGRIAEGVIEGSEIVLLFPDTFMNLSGKSVRKLVPKGEEDKLILIYDDIDLPLGTLKVSFGRGAGGHNGVDSVIKELDTKDFVRVRVGIAPKNFFGRIVRPKGDKLGNYVLGNLTKNELEKVREAGQRAIEAVAVVIREGKGVAMERFN